MLSFFETIFKIIAFSAGCCIVSLIQPVNIDAARPYEIGIVIADHLNVRKEPGMDKPSVKVLQKGSRVKIFGYKKGWIKITHNGKTGYIRNRKRYVKIINLDTRRETDTLKDKQKRIRRFKKEAENIGRNIQKEKKRVITFSKKEAAIVSNLNKMDIAIDGIFKQINVLKSQLAILDKKIDGNVEASTQLVNAIRSNEGYVAGRLVAYYKLSWMGKINILASARSIYDLLQRKKTMELILAYDEKISTGLKNNRSRLQSLIIRLNDQKAEKTLLKAKLEKQAAIISEQREKRTKLLNIIRNQKSLELAAIEAFEEAAGDLGRAIRSLDIKASIQKKNATLPSKSFKKLKGLLKMPVKGNIVSFFGSYKNKKFNVVNFNSGIEIKADRGEPVHAVCGGRVLYANWFKGYGNMIIIDHGKSYYTVYAHAQELFASKGDRVETGQVVATVGDSGSITGPGLHFEVRYHGKPIDPLKWIKKG